MDLNHEFIVNVPVNDAWVILTDLERIYRLMTEGPVDND